MFTDSDSFYYCPGGDLTNTVQRQAAAKVVTSITCSSFISNSNIEQNNLQNIISTYIIIKFVLERG